MVVRVVFATAGLVAAFVLGTAAPTIPASLDFRPLSPAEARAALVAATWRVVGLGCRVTTDSGTAALLADGRLVTNRHVVEGSRLLDVVADAGPAQPRAAVVSPADDVAVLPTAPDRRHGLTLAGRDPAPGDRVTVAGFPGSYRLRVVTARVAATVDGAPLGQSGPVLRLRLPLRPGAAGLSPGMSGSPVLDAAGHLAGLVFAVDHRSGEGLALPASTLRQALAGPLSPAPGC
jgi:S1-C subfamily serine protease